VVGFPVTGLGPVTDRVGAGADVGQRGPLVGVAGLTGPAARSAHPQALACAHVEHSGVQRAVDRLDTDPPGCVLGSEVSPDRFGRTAGPELGGDAVPHRSSGREERCFRPAQAPFGAPLGEGGPVVAAPSVGVHFAAHGARVTADPPGDHRPVHTAILDQRAADLLAFGQRQRRAWHPGISNGRCGSTAPVIMTGTAHRPLELADLHGLFAGSAVSTFPVMHERRRRHGPPTFDEVVG